MDHRRSLRNPSGRRGIRVHYPTDVLAGAVLGVLLGWMGFALVSRVENRRAVQKKG